MTDMELDIFERAGVHYMKKHNKRKSAKSALKYLRSYRWSLHASTLIVMEFWEDYFSGKHIYTIQEFSK